MRDFGIPTLVAVVLTWWMTADGREIAWQKAGFEEETKSWPIGDEPFWRFLYEFAALPVVIVCLAAIAVLVLSARFPRFWAWRRVGWYSLSLLLLGPGLIANLWMKETWGRPRPREVTLFGGRYPYETVFGMDFTGEGKSFPCGHATMGFYFVGLAFLLRASRPGWAWVVLALSLAWGGLVGYTRVLQGGHFPSDVVWAAWVMIVSSAILYRCFRLDRSIRDDPADRIGSGSKIPLKTKMIGGSVAIMLVGLVGIATPYRGPRDYTPLESIAAESRVRGSLTIERGENRIEPSDDVFIRGEAWGHGLPTSRIADRWEEEIEEPSGTWRFRYLQRYSGLFTEVDQRLSIGIPWERTDFLKLDLGPGRTELTLSGVEDPARLELMNRGSELVILVPEGVRIRIDPREYPVSIRDDTQLRIPADASQQEKEGFVVYSITVKAWEGESGFIELRSLPVADP